MMRLSYYQPLYYPDPKTDFERSVNENLDHLCVAAQGCGIQALQAQARLKLLMQLPQAQRVQAYQAALNAVK